MWQSHASQAGNITFRNQLIPQARRSSGPRDVPAVPVPGVSSPAGVPLPGPARYVVAVQKPLELPFDPIERAAQIWARRFGDAKAMAAVTAIMRVQQILLAELDGLLRPHDLTFARYEALVLLSFSREGALPMRLIGQRLMVHPTSVTNTIDRLEQQGHVVRKPHPYDGRGRLAEITSSGRAVVEKATADLMTAKFGMSGYGEAELEELSAMLRSLRVAAGDFVGP
jgi:DNA-binding MarR family transcriptional regulator